MVTFFIVIIVCDIINVQIALVFLLTGLFGFYGVDFYGWNKAFLRPIALLTIAIAAILLIIFWGLIGLR